MTEVKSEETPISQINESNCENVGYATSVGNINFNSNTLRKELNARHMTMIALGGSLGIGLIVGTGHALTEAGPASVLLGYGIVGIIVYMVMCSVGEMATYIPLNDGFTGYASRYVDPCLGFAVGYTYWFNYLLFTPNQATAASMLAQFWVSREQVNPGVWIAIFLGLTILLNILGSVKFFGEFEYWLSAIKIATVIGLVISLLVISLGGGPDKHFRGFSFWDNPGAFKEYSKVLSDGEVFHLTGSKGQLVAFISVVVTAVFSYLGVELIGVTVGESANPRKNIPNSIKMTFFRTIVFYILSILVIGMSVAYNDPKLAFTAGTSKISGSKSPSPFLVAIENSKIIVLPHIINALFIMFILGAGVAGLYIGGRTLYGLAINGQAPKIFAKTNDSGTPINALLATAFFSGLGFLNCSSSSAKIFAHFVNFVAVLGLLTWITILITHISFMKAVKAQGMSREKDLPWKAPFQPYGSYIAIIFCGIITLIKNVTVFLGPEFDYISFITGNLGIPLFIGLALGYKYIKGTKHVSPYEADLTTMKDVVDREEREFIMEEQLELQRNPITTWKKAYDKTLYYLF